MVVTALRALVVFLALAAACALLVSFTGFRLGWWSFRTGIFLVIAAGFFGISGAALALSSLGIARVRERGRVTLVAALVASGAIAAVTGLWAHRATSLPRIHDISTDTENPPAFVAVLPLRKGAENSAAYGGKDIAGQQRKAYPDIQPLLLALPPQAAFARARDTAQAMGWQLVAADEAAGRIEATDTTFWFRFSDDIVIRVTATSTGSRVDVRSVSRVGLSDVGTNAKRIRAFLERLR